MLDIIIVFFVLSVFSGFMGWSAFAFSFILTAECLVAIFALLFIVSLAYSLVYSEILYRREVLPALSRRR